MKLIYVYFLLLTLTTQCRSQQNLNSRRIKVIEEAMQSFSKLDTLRLYNLIDTSTYFETQDKEGFLFAVNRIHQKLKTCHSKIDYVSLKAVSKPVHTTEYILKFCRDKADNMNDSSFDIIFLFTDYEKVDKIKMFEINMMLNLKKTTPTKPL